MADRSTDDLRQSLRSAGLSREAIDAAWPAWWDEGASSSPSARAELRFALARNLGLSAPSLLGSRVEFVWRDRARFKNLSDLGAAQQAALTSFGTVVGRSLIRAVPEGPSLVGTSADALRRAILASQPVVELGGLLATSWGVGIPVIFLRVFALDAKRMHAMVVEWDGRQAILLGHDASYPAPVAFTLAHEMGHVALRHLDGATTLVDVEDPATGGDGDADEKAADRFALQVLTGMSEPDIRTDRDSFGGRQLAQAVLDAGPPRGIDPGALALCVGFRTGRWPAAMSSLRYIYGDSAPAWMFVNGLADKTLDWDRLGSEAADHLRAVMGLERA